jgi:hypothetical protein
MKRLIVVGLFLNAALLGGRFWQELSADAEVGGGAGKAASENGDVNGSGVIDISDASYLLNWLFLGGPAPVACAGGSGDLEARVSFLEGVVGSCFPDVDQDGLPDCSEQGGTDDSDQDGFADEDDCAPFDRSVNPGAEEICDGRDNNCDGVLDGPTVCDSDQDGVVDAKDCDPFDPEVRPGVPEDCFDGRDNNCDGVVDENCVRDDDQDGFASDVDCDDTDAQINPAAPEVCDHRDNNCDGVVDEGFNLGSDVNNCGNCGVRCDDGNPCTLDLCIAGQCAHPPAAAGTTCPMGGICDGNGTCTTP